MTADAWSSGFVVVTVALAGAGLELAAIARRRRRCTRPDCEPIPWRELERYR